MNTTLNEKIKQYQSAAQEAVEFVHNDVLNNLQRKESLEKDILKMEARLARLRGIEDVVSSGDTVKEYLKNTTKIEQVLDQGILHVRNMWKSLTARRNLRAAMFRA